MTKDENMEAAPRIELGIKVLQTSALPLGYAAIYGAENEARTRDPHLGKVVLYHLATSACVLSVSEDLIIIPNPKDSVKGFFAFF